MCFKTKINEEIRKYYIEDLDKSKDVYENVVKNYIEYYHFRACMSKVIYYAMNTTKIIAVACIPVLQISNVEGLASIGITIASGLGVIIEGLMAMLRVHQKWQLYRNTSNSLLREQREYATETGKYADAGDKKLALYVENVEFIVSEEARKWSETVRGLEDKRPGSSNEQTEED